jgi:RND family efflux transporter MFP subunit
MDSTRPKTTWLALAAVAAVAAPAHAGTPPPEPILLHHCKVEYARSSLLGASQPGVIKACLVRPGDRVKAGQLLVNQADGVERAELDIAAQEMNSDLDLRLVTLKHKRSVVRLRVSSALNERNAMSGEQLKLDQVESEIAVVEVEQARQRQELAKLRYAKALEAYRARQVLSPFDGVVSELLKTQGEAVLVNDPILRVDEVNRLRVVGRLDVVDAWGVRVGQKATLHVELGGADAPIEKESFTGTVAFVDGKVDPETQTCRVVAEVENGNHALRAGLEASMRIDRPKPGDDGPTRVSSAR